MTISLKLHVNGKYKATVKHAIDGISQPDAVVWPQEEKHLWFTHGKVNTYEVIEEYLGESWAPEPETVP